MSRALLIVVFLSGCEGVLPAPDWQQMIDQHKARPYEASRFFSDGRAMRPPPENTIARAAILGPVELTTGRDAAGAYVEAVPLPLSRRLLDDGRARFDTYCAACHGLTGDGHSEVARHMELRRPPSLVDEAVRRFPDGRVYQVISEGYGLMPSYRQELSLEERWAVVAYLRALELAAAAPLDELPASVRADAERALTPTRTP